MKKNNKIIALLLVLSFTLILVCIFYKNNNQVVLVNNFYDCINEGNAVMESYPRQCRAKDGRLFVEDIGNELDKLDLIQLNYPRPNDVAASPLEISGNARGYWYFEADFPVVLKDLAGNIIFETVAVAQDEWMTEDFVEFKSILYFDIENIEDNLVNLFLKKDNPTGLPEFDDYLYVPLILRDN